MSIKTDTTVISNAAIDEELIYDTISVSKFLGVQESTLRKYCSLMQKHNYEFNKNSVGHRVFYKKDIEVIKKIVELKNSTSLTLNQAVKSILESDIEDIDSMPNFEYNKLLDEFTAFKKEQMEFNKKLFEQLQIQENYIKKSIQERDKHSLLTLRESMEVRRQIAAAEFEKEKQRNKKSWWKFWR